MSKTSEELKKIQKQLEKRQEKINEKLDENQIASAIYGFANLDDVEPSHFALSYWGVLHSSKTFDKFIKNLPEDSYIHGTSHGGKIGEVDIDWYYDNYLLMTDDYTVVEIQLIKKHVNHSKEPKEYTLWIGAYRGKKPLELRFSDGADESVKWLEVIDPACFDNVSVDEFNVDANNRCISFNGKQVSSVIGITNIEDLVETKNDEHWFQKVKK
jgi:hypothetical protein